MALAAHLLFALLLCVSFSGEARAGGDSDPDTEIAQRHFRAGTEKYLASDYRSALTEFEAARTVKPLPAFDFNIARCHDRLEQVEQAIAAYRRYLSSHPTPDDAGEVRQRVEQLEARRPGRSPTAAQPAAVPAANPLVDASATAAPPPRASRALVWVVVVAAAVVVVGAVVALAAAFGSPRDPEPTLGRAEVR